MNCKFCNRPVTWDNQKYTFRHLQYAGHSIDVALLTSPSHIKCAKKYIKDNKIQKQVNATSAT